MIFESSYIPKNIYDEYFAQVCEYCGAKYSLEWANDDSDYAQIDCDEEFEICSHLEARISRIEEIITEGIIAACNRVNLQISKNHGGK